MQKMFCYSVRSEAYKIELSYENYLINYLRMRRKIKYENKYFQKDINYIYIICK